jgi:hypothetical protein
MVPMSNLPPLPDDSPALIPAVVEPAEEEKPQRLSPGAIAGGIVGAVLLLALVFGVAYLAITSPDGTRTARDVAIIFLALMSIFVVAALVILIILISRLVIMLQVEIKPMLESLNETTRTLRGTATFMSENMVKPVISASGYAEGARRFLEVLIGIRPRKTKKQP